MARGSGSWLEGPSSARPVEPGAYPGSRLGLPEQGPGSIARAGRRIGAFVIDVALAGLMGGVIDSSVSHPSAGVRTVAANASFVVMYAVLLAVAGQTIGMRVTALRVVPVGQPRFAWPIAVTIRTLLLVLLLPAIIFDRDQRGLHDKAAGTAIVAI